MRTNSFNFLRKEDESYNRRDIVYDPFSNSFSQFSKRGFNTDQRNYREVQKYSTGLDESLVYSSNFPNQNLNLSTQNQYNLKSDPQNSNSLRRSLINSVKASERHSYSVIPFSNYTSKLSLLPEKTCSKKTLVLDLDETLIHSSFTPTNRTDFTIKIESGNKFEEIYVLKRPGVDEFLEKMSKIYEIVIFTASISKYADPLLDRLDPRRFCRHRLFRDSCNNVRGAFVKDLSRLGRRLNDLIIIDNSPISFSLQVDNGIPIKSWYDDKFDKELYQLTPILEFLSSVPDVRSWIKKFCLGTEISYQLAWSNINREKNSENLGNKKEDFNSNHNNSFVRENKFYDQSQEFKNKNQYKLVEDRNGNTIKIQIINNNINNYILDPKNERNKESNKQTNDNIRGINMVGVRNGIPSDLNSSYNFIKKIPSISEEINNNVMSNTRKGQILDYNGVKNTNSFENKIFNSNNLVSTGNSNPIISLNKFINKPKTVEETFIRPSSVSIRSNKLNYDQNPSTKDIINPENYGNFQRKYSTNSIISTKIEKNPIISQPQSIQAKQSYLPQNISNQNISQRYNSERNNNFIKINENSKFDKEDRFKIQEKNYSTNNYLKNENLEIRNLYNSNESNSDSVFRNLKNQLDELKNRTYNIKQSEDERFNMSKDYYSNDPQKNYNENLREKKFIDLRSNEKYTNLRSNESIERNSYYSNKNNSNQYLNNEKPQKYQLNEKEKFLFRKNFN